MERIKRIWRRKRIKGNVDKREATSGKKAERRGGTEEEDNEQHRTNVL
jgi:hypothetical protein